MPACCHEGHVLWLRVRCALSILWWLYSLGPHFSPDDQVLLLLSVLVLGACDFQCCARLLQVWVVIHRLPVSIRLRHSHLTTDTASSMVVWE